MVLVTPAKKKKPTQLTNKSSLCPNCKEANASLAQTFQGETQKTIDTTRSLKTLITRFLWKRRTQQHHKRG